MRKTAVIAGTPVDTKMGYDFLKGKDESAELLYLPFAESPRECHLFQLQNTEYKQQVMRVILKNAMAKGAEAFFVYCNSLGAAVNYKALSKELNVPVITPMSAYERLAEDFNCLGVIAANNQATKGIEESFTAANEDGYVIGIGNLKLVEAVEAKMPPEEIVNKYKLHELSDFLKASGCEALALSCTHFPYFKNALQGVSVLPVIDPAEIMYEMLTEG